MIKNHENDIFKKEKVMTIDHLSSILNCCNRTVQRRLVEWHTYTSYNHNGKYYTLPTIPKFDKKGLWSYKGIFFSKNGNLKQTIVWLINNSPAGLSVIEASDLLKVSLSSFLSQEQNLQQLQREKMNNRFVYFSSNEKTFFKQKQKRQKDDLSKKLTRLCTDAETIIILVERIKHPDLSIEQLTMRINRKGHKIKKEAINHLFKYHGLEKKTLNSK